jgi:hypothetical protein
MFSEYDRQLLGFVLWRMEYDKIYTRKEINSEIKTVRDLTGAFDIIIGYLDRDQTLGIKLIVTVTRNKFTYVKRRA